MARLAIIGGTGVFQSKEFGGNWKSIDTDFGKVQILQKGEIVLLQRHSSPPVPPHRINHKANIAALEDMEVQRIIAFNSVGSLRPELKPGTVLLPNDFLCPWEIPTFYDKVLQFTTPAINAQLHTLLAALLTKLGIPHADKGTYVQAKGPRFETKAEIRMFATFGDVVGMTLASEATLACESCIPYAAVCSIDNYANGVKGETVSEDIVGQGQKKNLAHVEKILGALLEGRW